MKQDLHPAAIRTREHRRRVAEMGIKGVLLELPEDAIAALDALKQRHGLRSRGQVVLQLIEQGREATQQIA